jgi:hypothetical protein
MGKKIWIAKGPNYGEELQIRPNDKGEYELHYYGTSLQFSVCTEHLETSQKLEPLKLWGKVLGYGPWEK